jgi:3-hydroxyisobutyrate dehydrogenase-like beta-hydroxyacid dehydrogenase
MTAREQGAVTVFAGGRPADFERAKPLLEAVGGTVGFLGPPGSGAAVKICNNLMHFCNALGLFEGLRLAAAYGIDEPAMIRLGATSTARSWALTELASIDQILLEHTLADDEALFDFFAMDLEIAVAEAQHAALPLPFADRAAELVRDSFKKRRDSVRQIRTR